MTTGHLTPPAPSAASDRWSDARLGWLAFALILVVALIPRVVALGDQALWIDEDLTWLATNGVLETGEPVLPSGSMYPRAPLYTYLASASLWIAERTSSDPLTTAETAVALRIPSVIFSMLLVVVVFLFGRALGGWAVGVTAALIIACSPWDVHYARMARMYELLVLLFTLTVYLAYRGLMLGERAARIWMLVTAALALAAHQQAATLAAVFVVPVLFPRRVRPPIVWMVAGFLVTAIAYKLVGAFTDWGFSASANLDIVGRKEEIGAVQIPVVGLLVDLNHARFLLVEVLRANAAVGVAGFLGVLVAGAWNAVRLAREGKVLAAAAAVVFGLALVFNQYVLAGVAAFLVVKLAESTVSGGMRRGIDLGIAVVAALVLTLGAVALAFGTEALTDRMVLRSFLALPVPWYKRLFQTYPLMVVTVAIGIGVYYLRELRPMASHRMLFLIAAFAVPLLGQGLVYSPYFGYRYNFYLSPLIVIFFAMCVVPVVQFLTAAMTPRGRRIAVATTMVGVTLVILGDAFDPKEAFAVHRRGWGYNRHIYDHPDLNASYNYDFPSTAAYVETHRRPGDVVIARDPVNLYSYMGPTDYVVSAPYDGLSVGTGGERVDFYIGMPYIGDASHLAEVLNAHAEVGRWIIYTTSAGPEGPHTNLPDDVLDYLTALKREHLVHTGRDETTVVLGIPPGVRVPAPEAASPVAEGTPRRP